MRKHTMRKRNRALAVKAPRLRCPGCGERLNRGASGYLSPQPGDLTECRCRRMLEYVEGPNSLSLRIAPSERVRALMLALKCDSRPSLSDVVNHVIKYRQMHRI